MRQPYLALLLAPLLLALPTSGYAEQSAIFNAAETNTTRYITFDRSALYIAVGTTETLVCYVHNYNVESSDKEIANPTSVGATLPDDVTTETLNCYASRATAADFIESSDPEIANPNEVFYVTHLTGERIKIKFYIEGYNRGICTLTVKYLDASAQLYVRVIGPEEFEYSNICIDGVYYNFDRETRTAEVVKVPEGIEPYKGKITIPSELEWYGIKYAVTSVGEYAFASCDVSSVQLPTSLKEIKENAFTQSKLTYIDILDAVESIGESAFKDCASLESVYLGKSVKTIGLEAFTGCTKLKQFFISDDSSELSENDGVIYDKNLTKLILVPYGKESVSIPASVKTIGTGSFMGNKLINNIDFPDNLEKIEEYACAGCISLNQVIIPDKVGSIGDFSFSDCPNISKISLGDQIITVGANAFGDSQTVSKIYAYSFLPPIILETSFANFNATLFVPKGRRGSYANADIWKNFKEIEEFDPSSGAEDIEMEENDGIADIYNLQGILVKRNASKADMESLPTGFYIINGKKEFVK